MGKGGAIGRQGILRNLFISSEAFERLTKVRIKKFVLFSRLSDPYFGSSAKLSSVNATALKGRNGYVLLDKTPSILGWNLWIVHSL